MDYTEIRMVQILHNTPPPLPAIIYTQTWRNRKIQEQQKHVRKSGKKPIMPDGCAAAWGDFLMGRCFKNALTAPEAPSSVSIALANSTAFSFTWCKLFSFKITGENTKIPAWSWTTKINKKRLKIKHRHLWVHHEPYRIYQLLQWKLIDGDGLWPESSSMHSITPERLITKERHNSRWALQNRRFNFRQNAFALYYYTEKREM